MIPSRIRPSIISTSCSNSPSSWPLATPLRYSGVVARRRTNKPSRTRRAATESRKPRKRPDPTELATRRLRERKRKRVVKQFRNFGYALAHRDDGRREPIPVVDLAEVEVYEAAPIGVYQNRDVALAAAQNLRGGGGFSSGLAVGLAAVAVAGLGIVLCYLLFRRKGDDAAPLAAAPAPAPQPIIIQTGDNASNGSSPPAKPEASSDTEPDREREPIEDVAAAIIKAFKNERTSRIRNAPIEQFTLNSLDPRLPPTCIAVAQYEPIDVVVRCIQPNNSYAILAFSPTDLDQGAQVIRLPAGVPKHVHIPPQQALYAKGAAPGGEPVTVTVAPTLR